MVISRHSLLRLGIRIRPNAGLTVKQVQLRQGTGHSPLLGPSVPRPRTRAIITRDVL
jgi:hypothetical protein